MQKKVKMIAFIPIKFLYYIYIIYLYRNRIYLNYLFLILLTILFFSFNLKLLIKASILKKKKYSFIHCFTFIIHPFLSVHFLKLEQLFLSQIRVLAIELTNIIIYISFKFSLFINRQLHTILLNDFLTYAY